MSLIMAGNCLHAIAPTLACIAANSLMLHSPLLLQVHSSVFSNLSAIPVQLADAAVAAMHSWQPPPAGNQQSGSDQAFRISSLVGGMLSCCALLSNCTNNDRSEHPGPSCSDLRAHCLAAIMTGLDSAAVADVTAQALRGLRAFLQEAAADATCCAKSEFAAVLVPTGEAGWAGIAFADANPNKAALIL